MSIDCNPFGAACIEYSGYTAKELLAKDKKAISEYRVVNRSQHYFVKIRVDGCLIEDSLGLRKCDFLFLDCTES